MATCIYPIKCRHTCVYISIYRYKRPDSFIHLVVINIFISAYLCIRERNTIIWLLIRQYQPILHQKIINMTLFSYFYLNALRTKFFKTSYFVKIYGQCSELVEFRTRFRKFSNLILYQSEKRKSINKQSSLCLFIYRYYKRSTWYLQRLFNRNWHLR